MNMINQVQRHDKNMPVSIFDGKLARINFTAEIGTNPLRIEKIDTNLPPGYLILHCTPAKPTFPHPKP